MKIIFRGFTAMVTIYKSKINRCKVVKNRWQCIIKIAFC